MSALREPAELLRDYGIHLTDFGVGRHYALCPQCSAQRKPAHRNMRCLGVSIEPDGRVGFGCNHCSWTGPGKGNGKGGDGRPLTSYVYRDKDGIERFRKVRNAPGRKPKFFLQQPDGRGGWSRGTKGVDTGILYRADEVARAITAGRTILCVEGEKDVDALWREGFASTCNSHGASEMGKVPKWTAKHSAQLKGADIVVLNDEDGAGYAHADMTCQLSVGVAKRVRRLILKHHWAEIEPGNDVSDWLSQGHTGEELQALVKAAPDYDGGPPPPPPPPPEDEIEIERLARLPTLDYDRARVAAAKQLGCRPAILDRLRAAKRAELGLDGGGADGLPGRPITFEEIEPWEEPVNGEELLTDLSSAIGAYVIMNKHQCDAAALGRRTLTPTITRHLAAACHQVAVDAQRQVEVRRSARTPCPTPTVRERHHRLVP